MQFTQLEIEGLWLLTPHRIGDDRGYFAETFKRTEFEAATGANGNFIQDNESESRYGVVRGLHFQRGEFWQAKIVRVTRGAVLDVAVDLRAGSPTFGRYVGVELSAENGQQLYIPRGFAHGFAVLTPEAQFQYKVDNVYEPSSEQTLSFRDTTVAVDWRIPEADMTISPKDLRGLPLAEIESYIL